MRYSRRHIKTSDGTQIKQDRQFMHNVTFRRVRANTVAIEKQ